VRGFNMIGALTPQWCSNDAGVTARDQFGSTELNTAINQWHANTIRLQVSQRGLEDPSLTSTEIDAYLQEVENDVALARSLNLVVILSMQDQSIGCGDVHPLPSAQTVAAWESLVPAFANSPYVMFEMFNEPQTDATDADWAQWRNGGSSPLSNFGDTAVGHQTIANDIRGWGANNVLIADGARYAEHLNNISSYLLTDTSAGDGIAYAIHPYYYTPGATYWKNSYGYLTPSHVILATEWNYKASDCGTTAESMAPTFLTWLEQHGIGMTAHAFDLIGTQIADWNWTPTQCGTAVGGSGSMLKSWYAHLDQTPAAPTSLSSTGTATSVTVAWHASSGTFAIAGYDVSLNGAHQFTTTQLTATLGGLQCGTSYTVGVDARDIMGNTSAVTNLTAPTASCSALSITSLSAAPQPLVTSTTITFTLNEAATVNLDIETSSGTIVKHRMTNQALPSGTTSTAYYGYSDSGTKLASGSYLVVVTGTDSFGNTAPAQITLQIG
jgi:Cellulase (glycosyl hydrolase family 5)/FlgD Ig-like domain